MATFDDVRRIALALPEAEEILTWETDVTFRVRSKIFVIGADGSQAVSIKSTPPIQAELIDRDAATFASAAYVGRFGWISVRLDRIEDSLLRTLIVDGWRLTAPKRLAAGLTAEETA
jgi:predicted DNA-binding protein (MmcQ/YjbR family)